MNSFVEWSSGLESLEDSALVGLAREGDGAAFEELVRRHDGRVRAQALKMLRDPIEAQDVVQDTFLRAYRKLHSFRGDAAFSSWLYRICANNCLMRMRTRRRHPETHLLLENGEEAWERPVESPQRGADEHLENRELGEQILAGVAELPESYQEVLRRADMEHKTMRQIAEELELTVPNVKTRLHRARVRLREVLGPYLEAEPQAA